MSQRVKIYSDGGARGNPGPAAIGIMICNDKDEILKEHRETIGEATNNVAEYTAVIVGLELAKQLGVKEIDYFVDSELVAFQLSGKYRVKTPHIQTLYRKVLESKAHFQRVNFRQVPRTHEGIRHVDQLVNEALDREGY